MSLHSLALHLYKRAKEMPLVGRLARTLVSALKTTFAAWHYSENRLKADFLVAAPSGSASPPLSDPGAEVARVSRRLSALEARIDLPASRSTVSVEMRDADGLVSRIEWTPGTDMSRLVPASGLAALVLRPVQGAPWSADSLVACAGAVAPSLAPGGVLDIDVPDAVEAIRQAADLATARAVAARHGIPDPDSVRSALAAAGLSTPSVGFRHGAAA